MEKIKGRNCHSAALDLRRSAIAVVIATTGRAEIVEGLLDLLVEQTFKPTEILISCVTDADVPDLSCRAVAKVIKGRPGLAAQRNAALDALSPHIDIVVFFDDDFVPARDWLSVAAQVFEMESSIVSFTGDVIADGIKGPGLKLDHAKRLLASVRFEESGPLIEPYSPYGCNMAFRRSAISALRFDERLVLYGWLEDRDFGGALAHEGGYLVKSLSAKGVHLGVKKGRMAGKRLGYSQVINPVYLMRKGTMSCKQTIIHIGKNILSNILFSVYPELYIDRRGRLLGNVLGIIHVCFGRIEPENAMMI